MSSAERLREFVNERLTAATEEIFGVFKQTIVEYEKEIDRQRRLLDLVWKPEIKLHRIDLPQQRVCKEEELLTDQQLCVQERNFTVDQKDSEPPQIKEEEEELCISQEGEQLVLREETETFRLTPTLNLNTDKTIIAAEKDSALNIPVNSSVLSEAKHAHQLLSDNSNVKCTTSGKDFKYIGLNVNAGLSGPRETHTIKKPHSCKICGKHFTSGHILKRHLIIHTDEKPYLCKTCGKRFNDSSTLKRHMKIHTGERPYLCKTCGRGFIDRSALKNHIRIHTGERPFPCTVCGRAFRCKGKLTAHVRRHTGREASLKNFQRT